MNLSDLLDELLLEILGHLSGPALLNLSLASAQFHNICQDESIWYNCVQRERPIKYKSPNMTWKRHYLIDFTKVITQNRICPHFNIFGKENLPTILRRLDELLDGVNAKKVSPESIKCQGKGCTFSFDSLWLCSFKGCGKVGCGRRDNRHALDHARERGPHWKLSVGHSISIKLNTLDMWCYECAAWLGMADFGRHLIEVERFQELHGYLIEKTHSEYDNETASRRKKERGLRTFRDKDRFAAIIPTSWDALLERFIIGDAPPPGLPINCDTLIQNGRFNTQLAMGLDYRFTSLQAWEYLVTTYGGGPVILCDFGGYPFRVLVDPSDYKQRLKEEIEKDKRETEVHEAFRADSDFEGLDRDQVDVIIEDGEPDPGEDFLNNIRRLGDEDGEDDSDPEEFI